MFLKSRSDDDDVTMREAIASTDIAPKRIVMPGLDPVAVGRD
jgi:hypothetical protein